MRTGKRLGDRQVLIDNFIFEIVKITNKGNLLLRPVGKLDAVGEIEIAKDPAKA